MKIILSNRAAADLLQIYRYVAERNPAAAEAIIAEIDRKFEHLRDFPLIGRDRSSLRHRIRSIVAYRYSIFYEVCGVHPFYVPRSDPDKVDVNARCLDDFENLSIAPKQFDGKNWETSIQQAVPWR